MRADPKILLGAGAAAVVLAAASTVALAAATGGFGSTSESAPVRLGGSGGATCSVPSLPGAVVDVTVTDIGSRPGGSGGSGLGAFGQQPGSSSTSPSGGTARNAAVSFARVRISPSSISAGTVSLSVSNNGTSSHRVVVVPLGGGSPTTNGQGRLPGFTNLGSPVGEASTTCGSGAGNGIAAGGVGWTTMKLTAGRYAVVATLAGRAMPGMFAELDVTS